MKTPSQRIGRWLQSFNLPKGPDEQSFVIQVQRYFTGMREMIRQWTDETDEATASLAFLDEELYGHFGLTSQILRHFHQLHLAEGWDRKKLSEVGLAIASVHILALTDALGDDARDFKFLLSVDPSVGNYFGVSTDPKARDLKPFDHVGWFNLFRGEHPALRIAEEEKSVAAKRATSIQLTNCQLRLRETLDEFWALKTTGASAGGYNPRPIPLIVGPSGSGKTALVRNFAESKGFPMRDYNVGTWIVSGARAEPQTLCEMQVFLAENEHGVIFIDEVDKLYGTMDWTRSIQQEVFALLDGRTDSFIGWDDAVREKLARNFMIIGAGTWQSLYARKSRSVGFGAEADGGWSINLDGQKVIPEELLMRFNADVLFLQPLGVEEFAERITAIVADVGLPALPAQRTEELARQAYESGRHNRWLEAYASRLLRLKSKRDHD